MPSLLRSLLVLTVTAGSVGTAWAQGGIYACTDAAGRRLTSDRPMLECLDREQKELNPSGTVRRTLPPSLTAAERAAREDRERRLAEERQHEADERRLDRALVARYPNAEAHAADRSKALKAVEEAIATGREHLADLQREPNENAQRIAAQERLVESQEEEKKRIERRYDEELAKLKGLWARAAAATAAASAPARR